MKKIILSLVAIFAFASCSHDSEVYTLDPQTKAINDYNAAFVKAFGPVGSDVDWGFGSTKANTRYAAVNSNQWFDGVTEQFKHLVKPADVTEREEKIVSEWFKTNKNPTCDDILLTEFFVQQVYFGTKEYTAKDNNNAEHKVIGGQHMDYLYAGTVDNKAHINNFNTSAPQRTATGLSNMQLMQESSTANFGYHESFNSENQRYYLKKNRNWVIKAIPVDGVIGYYVGFDYESHGNQGDFEFACGNRADCGFSACTGTLYVYFNRFQAVVFCNFHCGFRCHLRCEGSTLSAALVTKSACARLCDCVAAHIRYRYDRVIERRLNMNLTFVKLLYFFALTRSDFLFHFCHNYLSPPRITSSYLQLRVQDLYAYERFSSCSVRVRASPFCDGCHDSNRFP